jgi:hypothetical protein
MLRRSRFVRTAAVVALIVAGLVATTAASSASGGGTAAVKAPGASYAATQFTTDLKGVCPNPLIVQTNWLPEADHGALYELIGSGGTMKQYSYEGPLGSTGINLQILSGGPGDANLPPAATLYSGNPVVRVTPDLIMDSMEDAVMLSKKFPTVGIMNLQDHDPQVLIYDPSRFKNLSTISALKSAAKQGAKFYVSGLTYAYVEYLIGKGVPSGSFIGGYSGDLDKFVTGQGLIVNQGYADSEPYLLAHDTPDWGSKPIKEVFIYKLGLNDYPSTIQVRADQLKSMSGCLSKLVPMLQKAVVDYFAHPATVNGVLAKFNPAYSATYWTTPVAESKWADTVQRADDIVGNSDNGDGPVGGFDMTRMEQVTNTLVPIFAKASPGTYDPSVKAAAIATNQFIDPSIRFP